jgi:hypothetical protein
MRGLPRTSLLIVWLMLVLVQSVPAFNVSQIVINPPAEWLPGTPVAVSGTIDFTPSPGQKFHSGHDLRFNTTLKNAQWRWTSSVKGVVTPVPSLQKGIIDPVRDTAFHYPENESVMVKFLIMGEPPAVNETKTITLLRIQEVDEKGVPVPGSSREYGEVLIYSEGPAEKTNTVRDSLEAFRDHLDEKIAEGVNTTQAETRYQSAQQKIDNSTTLPSYYYNAQIEKFQILDSAQNDINAGERLLDKAWAEKEIADATQQVYKTDSTIGQLKSNGTEPQIMAIVAKRERAVGYLSTAASRIAAGNYSAARENANTASALANESASDALREFRRQNSPSTQGVFIPAAGIGAVVLLIVGIWWRKR